MLERNQYHLLKGTRELINQYYRADEATVVQKLITEGRLSSERVLTIQSIAIRLIEQIRQDRKKTTGIESFLSEYSLSSQEGIVLMCMAEALLRVPDKQTVNHLIKDKLSSADWGAHQGKSDSLFVNATTWALILTGKVLKPELAEAKLSKTLFKLINRSSEVVVRNVAKKAMRIMSKQFVMGETIDKAIKNARKKESQGYRYSYDMLGEAALTASDAERYFNAYKNAIEALGTKTDKYGNVYTRASISIKLSALFPRYNETQRDRVMAILPDKLLALARLCKYYDIALTVDAEESERLDLSLDVIEKAFNDSSLDGWNGFGLAVQSYQKRAYWVLDWVAELARNKKRRMTVRLIKGAYWDSEIKKSQMQGLAEYPVFTRKVFTDVSFQACAKKLLTLTDAIYPQFATHNAYSVAMILDLVGDYRDFEFQCLHGMGDELYAQIVPISRLGIPCRIYAPVGTHEDLLPYLVRRLLENGANSSFVNRIVDDSISVTTLVDDPIQQARAWLGKINLNIPLPENIFMPERKNSRGFDFSNRAEVHHLQIDVRKANLYQWKAAPMGQRVKSDQTKTVGSPHAINQLIGKVQLATPQDIAKALDQAQAAFPQWSKLDVVARATCLTRYADLMEQHRNRLMGLLILEAGKTWSDALAEVREAIDFCRYYAIRAVELMAEPLDLKGYTGETNQLTLHGRGIALCISPWNFPLAIFTGQVVAALVTGNTVIAKPAEQTPLIGAFAVELMHQAGIPQPVIQLLPGSGKEVGGRLVADKRIKAVLFTGSTQTANLINQTLANRGGEIIPLIAETGGQNTMLVDSSALLEQVVNDVVVSAFGSAGQRCSALRVVYVQDEVYERFVELLQGAMAELTIGDPQWLNTDIGPVIDSQALANLQQHVIKLSQTNPIIYQSVLPPECNNGYFMPPTAIAIDSIHVLEKEVFGPILHVIRFKWSNLDTIIDDINNTGFGLTLGIHSRINDRVDYIQQRVHVGNCYVNRNMIGAVVGLQPFGGEGLSGTGPKAGGPHYLQRLCLERTVTVDTTAAGGNASLMVLPE